jgi:hypothetical protein
MNQAARSIFVLVQFTRIGKIEVNLPIILAMWLFKYQLHLWGRISGLDAGIIPKNERLATAIVVNGVARAAMTFS